MAEAAAAAAAGAAAADDDDDDEVCSSSSESPHKSISVIGEPAGPEEDGAGFVADLERGSGLGGLTRLSVEDLDAA